jgi:hypothetical protein
MFGLKGFQLGGAIAGIIAILAFIGWVVRIDQLRAEWHGKFDKLYGEAALVLGTTQRASNNPALKWADVPGQIDVIASSRKAWKETADLQSSRIDSLGLETDRLKTLNATARKKAQAIIAKRDTVIAKLANQAITPGERADCVAQLHDVEAALDFVYKENL